MKAFTEHGGMPGNVLQRRSQFHRRRTLPDPLPRPLGHELVQVDPEVAEGRRVLRVAPLRVPVLAPGAPDGLQAADQVAVPAEFIGPGPGRGSSRETNLPLPEPPHVHHE